MATLDAVMTPHRVEIPAHLEAEAEIPLVPAGEPGCALVRQGDVMVVTGRPGKVAGLAPVPAEGIPVVRGEAGGNTHLLVTEGPSSWAPAPEGTRAGRTSILLGTVDLAEGSAAYLLHPEHGAHGLAGPGQFRITRQRQQADEIELVRD